MKTIFSLVFLTILLFACNSSNEENKVVRKVSVKSYVAPVVHPNKLLTIEIEGMMCEMGCGASIRKELRATGAVGSIEYDFVDERKVNVAKIAFDKNKITVDKIISILTTMNDKQFTVGKSSTENYTDKKTEDTIVSEVSTNEQIDSEHFFTTETSKFEIPNLFSLFTRFFL